MKLDKNDAPQWETILRDYSEKHGPSGGAWNISMLLETFASQYKVEPKVEPSKKEEPTFGQRVTHMVTPRNSVVFLCGLACFILAILGVNNWATSFGLIALLAML